MMIARPKFLDYIITDENGYWGTEGASLTPDAPQWAKDEYREWKEREKKAKEEGRKK